MQDNRADPSAVPGVPTLSEHALLGNPICDDASSLFSELFATCFPRMRSCDNSWLGDLLTYCLFKVAHGFGPVVNSGLSNSVEAHCYMEGFGDGVGRFDIHLTDHSILPGLFRHGKEIVIKEPAHPKTSRSARDDDAIDVNKWFSRRLEPSEIRVLIWLWSSAIKKAVAPRSIPRAQKAMLSSVVRLA